MSLYATFQERTRRLADLASTVAILSWDQETMMPPAGGVWRARQLSTLAALHHEQLTDPAWEELLERLEEEDLDLWGRASLREFRRQYDKARRLPESLVRELAETTSLASQHWVRAREASDFQLFQPWLEKVLHLKRQQAACLQCSNTLYEALLDEYEPGMQEARLEELFRGLQPALSSLLQRIQASPVFDQVPALQGNFPIESQRELGREIMTAMGFDWNAGRLDVSPHPFCTGLTPRDVRITTRYSESDFTNSLFGILHETGHALYEQGLDPEHYGLPACDAISLGIHESQSRLWENQVGRSLPFWTHWFPRLRQVFAGRLEGVSLEDFLRRINRVRPSLIRVDADEVTYGLHVILRYELEQRMIQGSLEVAELPEAWNQRMEEYLGIVPERDAEGVLQDTHWSQGLIGYFPTYLLGNLYAAQIYACARRSIPDLEGQIRSGEMRSLREWLREQVHRPGKTLTADELIEKISGKPLDTQDLLGYLEDKFRSLYAI